MNTNESNQYKLKKEINGINTREKILLNILLFIK